MHDIIKILNKTVPTALLTLLVMATVALGSAVACADVFKTPANNAFNTSNSLVKAVLSGFGSTAKAATLRHATTGMPQKYLSVANSSTQEFVEGDHFIFHPGNIGVQFSPGLVEMPDSIFKEMAERYHYRQQRKIDYFVYTNSDKFLQGSPSRDAVGYAIPSENKIAVLMDGDMRNWQTTIAHEINHIIFIQSVPKINTVPQWFIEGLAIYESHPGTKVARIEEQALAKDLPDIISTNVNSGPAELQDYGQGYLLVGFIVREYGREALDSIIARLQLGADFNSAVLQTLSVTPEELNDRSKAFVGTELFYIWLLKLQDFEWYFATALFIVAGVVAFARKRRQLSDADDDSEDDGNVDGCGGRQRCLGGDKHGRKHLDENEYEGVDFGDGAQV